MMKIVNGYIERGRFDLDLTASLEEWRGALWRSVYIMNQRATRCNKSPLCSVAVG